MFRPLSMIPPYEKEEKFRILCGYIILYISEIMYDIPIHEDDKETNNNKLVNNCQFHRRM